MHLLDTHTLIWTLFDDSHLSKIAHAVIDENDDLFASIASLWEIAIKQGIGKLDVKNPVVEIAQKSEESGISILPIAPAHLDAVRELPPIHKDPFDRLIVAQAMCEGAGVVTKDENIAGYEVETIW